MPRVSILMATYNRAGLIGKTIQSLLAQTFKDWELIVPDDGSKDNTPEVMREWQKKLPQITYIRNEVNQGISKNYNSGFKVAKGEYIAMIDDDDPWCDPKKLEKQVKFLDENKDYVGCGGGMIVVSPVRDREGSQRGFVSNGVDLKHQELYRYFKPETDEQIRSKMLFGNPIANSTTIFRRSAGEKVSWYDESIRYSGDRDFWLKLGVIGKLYNFPEYFSYYTMSGSNTSIVKMRPHLKTSLEVMMRYKKNYPHYFSALIFNWIQYLYSFLPNFIKKAAHYSLARLKRLVVG